MLAWAQGLADGWDMLEAAPVSHPHTAGLGPVTSHHPAVRFCGLFCKWVLSPLLETLREDKRVWLSGSVPHASQVLPQHPSALTSLVYTAGKKKRSDFLVMRPLSLLQGRNVWELFSTLRRNCYTTHITELNTTGGHLKGSIGNINKATINEVRQQHHKTLIAKNSPCVAEW